MSSVGVGVIGYGYWGPNLVRNVAATEGAWIAAVADGREDRRADARRHYPAAAAVASGEELIARDDVDAVVIATPLATHRDLVAAALQAGKHVLAEKPLVGSVREGEALLKLADDRGLTLMVDHTFIYTGAVEKIRELVRSGELGDIYYFDSVRVNLGPFREDVDVLWDLGPHDLSIMHRVIPKLPVRVAAVGSAPMDMGVGRPMSVVYVTVWFADDTMAHFHLNWISPNKVRRMLIGGSRKMVVYDALDIDNQVKVFDRGVEALGPEERRDMLPQIRIGDMVAPKVDQTEALTAVLREFVDCVSTGATPRSGGREGLEVVRVLEAAQRSIDDGGTPVDL